MKVAIISHNRAEMVWENAVRLVVDGGFAQQDVKVFVGDTMMRAAYIGARPEHLKHVEIVTDGDSLGVTANRNQVTAYFDEGEEVLCVDDDIGRVFRKVSDKKHEAIPEGELRGVVADCFLGAALNQGELWGVYPVNNPFFMKDTIRRGCWFVIGNFHGLINRKELVLDEDLKMREDYERTLLYRTKRGHITRFDFLVTDNKFEKTPGGLQDEVRNDVNNEESCAKLFGRYAGLVRRKRRKDGRPEISLVNR